MKEHVKDKEIGAEPTKTNKVVVEKTKDLKEILSNYREAEKYLTQIRPDITLPTAKEITIAFINDNFYDIIMTPRPIQEQEQQKYIEKKKYVSYLLDQAKVNNNIITEKPEDIPLQSKQEKEAMVIFKQQKNTQEEVEITAHPDFLLLQNNLKIFS